MDMMIAGIALAISLCSLLISFGVWRRSFRPIVTVTVKTHAAGNGAILYDLVLLNSGAIPAKNILVTAEAGSLASALGADATAENKARWLACFGRVLHILHNNDRTSCSFGTTQANNGGFWKHDATIQVSITYEGWFGWKYRDQQNVRIADSDSFTGYSWG